MPGPQVSVVIATRNRTSYLPALLRSVAAQDLQEWECLVCDDGSSEQERARLIELCAAAGSRVRLDLSVPCGASTGPSAARNRGILQAQGRYVAFCDDDDSWIAADHLSTAGRAMDSAEADFYFASQRGVNDGKIVIPDWCEQGRAHLTRGPASGSPPVHTVGYDDFLAGVRVRFPHLNTVVVRRGHIIDAGLFWESIRYYEDVNFTLRAADRARRILFRPALVAEMSNTPHDRAYSAVNGLERSLIAAMSSQHLRANATRPETVAYAQAIEAWSLYQASKEAAAQGKREAARAFLRQSLWLKPGKAALLEWVRGAFHA